MRFPLVLLFGACCLALLGSAAAHGSTNNNLYGLVGKWQGVCVTKGYRGSCWDDIISYPYYVEYSYDPSYKNYYMQYRQDAVSIDTWSYNNDNSHTYDLHSYSDHGYVKATKSYDGLCVNVEYEHDARRTYRAKLKHEGELDVLIEEGEYDISQEHSGVWGKCPVKSWKSLMCDSYTYSYRCYLVRTSKWSWAWK